MLIGLHGKKRSGKDTACKFILEWAQQEGRMAKREAFADRLKLSAYRCFWADGTLEEALQWADTIKKDGWHVLYGESKPEEEFTQWGCVTGRSFLQLYGTEAHRDVFDRDFWINAVLPNDPGWAYNGILVITDVRFDNEAKRIRDLGGEIWHILREDEEETDTHASEQPLPETFIDATFGNHGSLDAFRDMILSALELRVFQESAV